ncbi:MAG: regulatory protein RecX [Nitrospirae bacterium]|nr:regulatory protein RecX [Nitrospirota bacterium]
MKDSHVKAKQYALKLLSYRGRSEKELTTRLKIKGINESVASLTVGYLKDIGLIDDFSLAETLKREALTAKLLSQNAAKKYVLNRGIPHDIVDIIFSKDEDADFDNARRIAEKKLRILKDYPYKVAKRRLCNLLSRKGYSYETIMKVLKERNFNEEDLK